MRNRREVEGGGVGRNSSEVRNREFEMQGRVHRSTVSSPRRVRRSTVSSPRSVQRSNVSSPTNGETLIVPVCSGLVDFLKGVCSTFVGAYILAIGPRRTRNWVEAIFFGIFGLGMLALNFGFIRQVFFFIMNLYHKRFGRETEGEDGADRVSERDDRHGVDGSGSESSDANGTRGEMVNDGHGVAGSGIESSDANGTGGQMVIDLSEVEVEGGEEGVAPYYCREHRSGFRTFAGLLHHAKRVHARFTCCLDCQVVFPVGENGASHFAIEHLLGIYPDPRGYFGEDDFEELRLYVHGKITV